MRRIGIYIGLMACLLLSSSNDRNIIYKHNGIEVFGMEESKEFNTAKLKSFEHIWNQSSKEFLAIYQISNYELKANSNNNLTGLCANSKDGQHIHVIVDNKPYNALYKTEQLIKEDTGSHLVLSFLSRSHHQSIKTKNAYKLAQIDLSSQTQKFDLKKPYLFYSRPKGTYIDNDTKEILLDFYLVNTTLFAKGNKVKVELDSSHTFLIKEWKPYLIRGLSMGEHKIKLSLIDNKNRAIKSPFLPVERSFILQSNPK